MKRLNRIYFSGALLSFTLLMSCAESAIDKEEEMIIPEGYTLVWADEFNESSVNPENWTYELGDGTDYGLPPGWGNGELQLYTNGSANAGIIDDGGVSSLYITATQNASGNYTSAKLTTQDLYSMRFGRVEVRAKLPEGQGIWPAIWMLGNNRNEVDWPGCGEIDLVEMLGNEPNKMYSTVHYTNGENKKGETQRSYSLSSGNFSDDYHTFSMNWTPENMSFYVDDEMVGTVAIESDMKEFQRSFYLILNVAVGGFWPGYPDNTTVLPQSMYVDYVRVFEQIDFVPPAPPALDLDEESIGQNLAESIVGHAMNETFTDFGSGEMLVWGGGGEPVVSLSKTSLDGDSSVVLDYPGGSWGGAYIELSTNQDASSFTHLNFSVQFPEPLATAEIKLESTSTNAVVYLGDYIGTDVGQGFMEYTIPLADFEGLDLTDLKIPFAMWNPQDGSGEFAAGTVLLDNIFFSN